MSSRRSWRRLRKGGRRGALVFLWRTPAGNRCADGQGQVFTTKAFEVLGGEMLAEAFVRAVSRSKSQGGDAPRRFSAGRFWRPIIGDQQLNRIERSSSASRFPSP